MTRWTNRSDGASGVSAVLTNVPGFEVLAVPGFIEGRFVLFAEPIPERVPIPEKPAGPGSWSVGNPGVVLLDVVHPSGVAPGRAVGPLAGQPQVIVAFRGVNRPDIRAGWMTFTREFELVGSHVASDYYPAAGITHPPSAWLDVNGDGCIDFARRGYTKVETDPRSWSKWEGTVLDCLTGSGVLAGGSAPEAMIDCREAVALEPGQLIARDPAVGGAAWGTNAVGLNGTFSWYQDFGGSGEASYRFVGYMGLRFQAEDGRHYGWWDGGQEAFEPRPGQPIAAGQTPASLGAWAHDGEIVITWNASLDRYILQSSPSLTAASWAAVSPVGAGRVALPLAGAMCYFRLRTEGQPRLIWAVDGHAGSVDRLSLSADGAVLLSAGADGAVRVWQSGDGTLRLALPAADRDRCPRVTGGALSPEGTLVAVGCWSGPLPENPFGYHTVRIYNIGDGHQVASFDLIAEFAGEPGFSPDGGYVYSSSGNPSGWMGSLFRFADSTSDVFELLRLFAPGGQLALGCAGQLLALPSGAEVRSFGIHTDCSWPAAFSADGSRMADGSGTDVRLWQVSDATLLRTLSGRSAAGVESVAFSPAGESLLVRTADQGVSLWRVHDGTWRWSQSDVRLAVFSPDGACVWALGTDGRVRSWRVVDGSLAAGTMEQFSQQAAVFSPDGTRLLTGSSNGTLACWDVADVTGTR